MLENVMDINPQVLSDMKYRVWEANLALEKAKLVVLTWEMRVRLIVNWAPSLSNLVASPMRP